MDRLNAFRRPTPPANSSVDEVLRYIREIKDAVRAGWAPPPSA